MLNKPVTADCIHYILSSHFVRGHSKKFHKWMVLREDFSATSDYSRGATHMLMWLILHIESSEQEVTEYILSDVEHFFDKYGRANAFEIELLTVLKKVILEKANNQKEMFQEFELKWDVEARVNKSVFAADEMMFWIKSRIMGESMAAMLAKGLKPYYAE